MRLILIRHGETSWNECRRFQGVSDIELSPKGEWQARRLAVALRGENIAAIFSSPLARARQTAEVIRRSHDCPLRTDERLKELNLGDLEGLTLEEVREKFPEFLGKWGTDPEGTRLPNGETLKEVDQRTASCLEMLCRQYPEETLAAIAHSFVNQTIICRALQLPLNHFRRIRQDATGVSMIEFLPRIVIVHRLNDTCHLRCMGADPFPG